MTITVGITHHTEYHYDKSISMSPHTFRLRPAPHSRTPIKSYSLKVYPENHFINWQQDPFGNYLARVVFPEKTKKFWFTVDLVAELTVINPFDFFLESYAEKYPFKYEERIARDLAPYLEKEKASSAFSALINAQIPDKPVATVDFLVAVNQAVYDLIEYGVRMEPGVQSIDETLEKKGGSCRDSAWLSVQMFRHLGLASRFVSGYLVQLAPDEKSLDGPSGPEKDFTDLHAWCEVYIPGAGWIGLDPTSGLFAGEGHIPLACTPEPMSAAPVTGAIDECESTFSFYNNVQRLHEPPRVTKPYSDAQWAAIDRLGGVIDNELHDAGINLTMGGEPTFISIDDMESDQWNTAADGKEKRELAHTLFMKMVDAFSQGGFRHYGQGKWYPGEPLPRWQYASYWRKDGTPIWSNQALLAEKIKKSSAKASDAEAFASHLSVALGLDKSVVVTAYEDVLYHLWQEGSLPQEPSPDAPELLDAMTRKGFLAKLEKGLDKPVGFVIPLTYDTVFGGWQSNQWTFKRGHCFLLPGDSPMGYRLPLNSLGKPKQIFERDPADMTDSLASITKQRGYVGEESVLTALCIEVRDGQLCIFMPPASYFEHYALLLNAVEVVAEKLKIPVILEGYTPPYDSRVEKFAVTPDPGVIEVNVHPATNWKTLVSNTHALYEMARTCRLGTEKFMLDGRHAGTGGGNHVTMGDRHLSKARF